LSGFPLLDVAIGLIFVYLLLSLICSSLNEGLESILRNRAIDLEAGIRRLLADEDGSWWASFLPWVNSIKKASITREFYSHPLIRNLFKAEERLPNYIPSRNFALAVLDLVGKDGSLVRGTTSHPDKLDSGSISLADMVNDVTLPAPLKESITTLIAAANGDTQQIRINVENWFNSSMDRVSGWYKSRTQKILFCIGVLVTIFVNADSLIIYRNLSASKNLQAIVNAGQNAIAQNPHSEQQMRDALDQLSGLDVGIGWASETDQHGNVDHRNLPPVFSGNTCAIEKQRCENPIGWTLQLFCLHAIGWLITSAAICLGAPFWFDTLNRFMVVRSTVKPKEKSEEEESKDRPKA
jgi:hypothetical protein